MRRGSRSERRRAAKAGKAGNGTSEASGRSPEKDKQTPAAPVVTGTVIPGAVVNQLAQAGLASSLAQAFTGGDATKGQKKAVSN